MNLIKLIFTIIRHPLNNGKKLASLIKFIKWQIASRLAPGPIVYEWIGGVRVIVRNGETGFTGSIYYGLQEYEDMAFLLHFLRKEDIFVDVGANIGAYSLLSAGVIGARTICFEPIPTTFSRLEDNLRINNLENSIQALNIGIGSKIDILRFTQDKNCTNHVVPANAEDDSSELIEVKCYTLDSILKEVGLSLPTMLKIDVEGYELEVLKGADSCLSKPNLNVVIMELNDSGCKYGHTDEDLVSIMNKHNFSSYSYSPRAKKLCRLEGKNTKNGNTIFVRDLPFVEERLQHHPTYSVNGSDI